MKRSGEEELLQQAVTKLFKIILPTEVLWTSIEVSNQQGGYKGRAKQKRLKAKGVRSGWPDMQLFWKDDGLKCLFLELKSKKGGLQDSQIDCHRLIEFIGMPVEVVRSLDDVQAVIRKHQVPVIG